MSDIRQTVREHYGSIGQSSGSCCGPGCCTPSSRDLGYSEDELAGLPGDADLGLGCGNPVALAGIQPGETVLDLGSGGGIDCFLAAQRVGEAGRVIGVDMTAEMLLRARANATRQGAQNVEFRLGEIEHLPVADGSVDLILSNCVINLSPSKPAVFAEAFRVLRPGGRLAITDMVTREPLPDDVRRDAALHVSCVAGAATLDELEEMLTVAGFEQIRIEPRGPQPTARPFSASITAHRP